MDNQAQSSVPNGKICYIQIPTNNIAASASFNSEVFGWRIRTRNDGSIAFDDVNNGVSGTWLLNRKPLLAAGLLRLAAPMNRGKL